MTRSGMTSFVAFTIALAAACGKPIEEASEAGSDATGDPVPAETAAVAVEREEPGIAFTAVELPEAFPTDFPIAPESTVVEARTRPDEDGALSDVTIVNQGEPEKIFEWYRAALSEAGWMVVSEERSGEAFILHATQGDSYIDFSAMPHPESPGSGWVRTRATIWKTVGGR